MLVKPGEFERQRPSKSSSQRVAGEAGTPISSTPIQQSTVQESALPREAGPVGSVSETSGDQMPKGQQGSVPLASQKTHGQKPAASAPRPAATASWSRYKEDGKYTAAADTNVNTKHVGASLRTLTLEDRLELRRKARAQAKKGTIAGGDVDDSLGVHADSVTTKERKVSAHHTKQTLQLIDDDEEDSSVVDTIAPSCLSGSSGNVDLTVDEHEAGRMPANERSTQASGTKKGTGNAVEQLEDLEIIQLDEGVTTGAAARRAQRKRRRVESSAAAAAPAPGVELTQAPESPESIL